MKFGSTKEVAKASIDELAKVIGISSGLAQKIHNFLNFKN